MTDKDFAEQDAKIRYICENVSDMSRLLQLGEECAELTQAIFKYLRKMSTDNPTPKTEEEIISNVKEEIMDVQLCIDCVDADMVDYEIYNCKLNRWNKRVQSISK
jgi:hypothetical protein